MSPSQYPPVYYDPYDRDIVRDPFPVYRQLREQAPLYYNEPYDFFALSRYADVEQALRDVDTYSSARGGILEVIKANVAIPPPVLLFQDPPIHTVYRALLQRMFTPRRMAALDVDVRAYCRQCLDRVKDGERFDFVDDLGTKVPMRVIGMLLGIPEQDHQLVRQFADTRMRTESGKPMDVADRTYSGEGFEAYVDWRIGHPSDDVITELLTTEFKDHDGTLRRLTREEVLTLVSILAGAGNETTNRLIGWTGKALGDHPDQRRQVVADRSLIPQTIEEVLRFYPPGTHLARYVTRDAEWYGRTVPAGSAMILLVGSANHDDRRFDDGDRFDIHREKRPHMTFGHGIHTCVGAVLARLEGRIALDEILNYFPDWEVDEAHAELSETSTVRGWERMPVWLPGASRAQVTTPDGAQAEAPPPTDVDGTWMLTIKAPTGTQSTTLVLERANGALVGTQTGKDAPAAISEAAYENGELRWVNHSTRMMKMTIVFTAKVRGDRMQGTVKAGMMGKYPFTGVRSAASGDRPVRTP